MPKNIDDPHPFNSTLGHILSMVCRTYRARAGSILESIGLYKGQEMILYSLRTQEGMAQSELAGCMHVKAATITNTLKRLERAGLIERRQDSSDQRISRVYLTPAGQAIVDQMDQIWLELEEIGFGCLDHHERELLRHLLFKVYSHLTKETPA
jgi:DNA-binding MarR family transcriptional regulator